MVRPEARAFTRSGRCHAHSSHGFWFCNTALSGPAAREGDFNYQSNLAFAYDQVGRNDNAVRTLRESKDVNPGVAQVFDQTIGRIEQKVGYMPRSQEAEQETQLGAP